MWKEDSHKEETYTNTNTEIRSKRENLNRKKDYMKRIFI